MASIETAFPSRFVKHDHLNGDTIVTIASARTEDLTFKDKVERKLIVSFKDPVCKDGPYEMVLNRTNAQAIAKATGTKDYEAWAGKRVTLYQTRTGAFGEDYDVVRVRDHAPLRHEVSDADADNQIPY